MNILRPRTKKLLTSIGPLVILVLSLGLAFFLSRYNISDLDRSWGVRQFVIGIFIFLNLSIVPNLLHLEVYIRNFVPRLVFNFSHHPPGLRVDHEFNLKNTSICSGCFGTFLGVMLNTILLSIYLLFPAFFELKKVEFFLLGGLFLILTSYSRYMIHLKPSLRLAQHGALIPGIGVTLIYSDLTFSSAFTLVVLLPSWIIILIGRVVLSKIDHQIIPDSKE